MRACYHHRERLTPLISTFAFNGAEFWCPWCGATEGFFNDCPEVPETDEMKARATSDLERARPFLTACVSLICSELKYEGRWVKPQDLPPEVISGYRATIDAWEYPGAIQSSPTP